MILKFTEKLTIHFRLFLYLETCLLTGTVSLLCRLQSVSKIHVPLYPSLIILLMGDEIVRPCDRHSNDTVTLRKHVTKYKNMWKWIVQFLSKFENRGIKIA